MARLLDRLRPGTLAAVRGRALRPLVRHREMQFPTFPREVHESVASKQDYFRYATLGLAVQRVLDEKIPGAFAEVGVWRGETSAVLHSLAPQRQLYLFDTFEGFRRPRPPGRRQRHEVPRHRRGGRPAARRPLASRSCSGRATSRRRWPASRTRRSRSRCSTSTCCGPTQASLEFFHPRLSPGGYLIVHDYNNPESDWACKRAFDDFLRDVRSRWSSSVTCGDRR